MTPAPPAQKNHRRKYHRRRHRRGIRASATNATTNMTFMTDFDASATCAEHSPRHLDDPSPRSSHESSAAHPRTPHNACVVLGAGDYYGSEADSLRLAGLMPADRAVGHAVGRAADCAVDCAAKHTATRPLVIAADGGLDHAAALGLTPDFVIGDFDSVRSRLDIARNNADAAAAAATTAAALAPFISGTLASGAFAGTPVITLPSQKDDADMLSALKAGWAAGAREFHIIGGLGGRLDHTLGNVQLLTFISRAGGSAFLYGSRITATAVTDGSVRFSPAPVPQFPMISVFSADNESHGVRIRGLKYEVSDFTVSNAIAQLSNELVGLDASISVEHGTLIVTYPAAIAPPVVTNGVAAADTLGALSTHVSSRLRASF